MTRESFHPPRSRSAALLRNVVAAAPIQIFARPVVRRCLRHRCRRRHPIERRLCSDSAADQLPSSAPALLQLLLTMRCPCSVPQDSPIWSRQRAQRPGRYRPSGRPLRASPLAAGGYRVARAAAVPSTRCRPGGILALHRCAHTHPSPMEVLRRARGIPRHPSSHRAPAACAHRPASSKAGDQCAAGVDAASRASPTRHQRLLLPPAGARRL